jgi:hypothetical protein
MPGLFSQSRGTVRTLQCLFCQVSVCSVVTRFAVFRDILYYSMYISYHSMHSFILFYVTSECICVQTTATGCLPNCSLQIYQELYHDICICHRTNINRLTSGRFLKIRYGGLQIKSLGGVWIFGRSDPSKFQFAAGHFHVHSEQLRSYINRP